MTSSVGETITKRYLCLVSLESFYQH